MKNKKFVRRNAQKENTVKMTEKKKNLFIGLSVFAVIISFVKGFIIGRITKK
ncbi:MAG: hypothetical protein N4A47_01080 [Clostridia bacterium]|jgi:hypothetical protein|nr:hypothetical protein [Clostridia bacterium]